MDFIGSEYDPDAPGADAEQEIWDRLKDAFGPNDTGVAYYKYPIVDKSGGRFDQEPDFVLFHQDFGLLIIECKGFRIHHIDRIEGSVWYLQNMSYDTATPTEQARSQGFHLRSYFGREPDLIDDRQRVVVPVYWLVALPNITRDEWESRGFHNTPSTPKAITGSELSPQALRDTVFNSEIVTELSYDQYRTGRAVLSGGQPISGARGSAPPDATKKGEIYQRVQKGLKHLDRKQEEIGVQIPQGPQQIRGIAGSGKTVLMAMKAARMHLRHPDWKIALTFFTKSLYQHITDLVHQYHWKFAEEEPNWDNLQIMHGWGGKTTLDGLYYTLALECGAQPRHPDSAKDLTDETSPPELFDACCEDLIDSYQIPELYDAILIDEAQDFEPNFYKLCREALVEPKRLIWAYDEAQSLGSLDAPSPKNIFGEDTDGEPIVDLSGTYEGGIQKSQIMRRAYRAPREVLMTAHIFGMGLKRDDGAVQAITTKDGWDNIGYNIISGDFRKVGEPVELERPAKHSPHPLQNEEAAKPFVTLRSFETKRKEVHHVADQIRQDVAERNLSPDEIIVIPLGKYNRKKEQGTELANQLAVHDIDSYRVWKDAPENREVDSGSVFSEEGKVTISGINRAKGNEAATVYVLGIDEVAKKSRRKNVVQRRNEVFVAITRSRAWCHITGIEDDQDVFTELRSILDQFDSDSDPVIEFSAPDPKKLKHEMESGFEEITIDDFIGWSDPEIVDTEDF
jgi:superfamily I DNA and RNA helicase